MRPLVVALVAMAACTGGGRDDAVTVFAAASLTDALTAIAERYDGEVELSFAGSSSLRAQIASGAPADVFASADEDDEGEPFATNGLVIAVAPGADVDGIEDFARDDLLLGVCAEEVPCGRLARAVLAAAGVDAAIDTEEPDVRAVLAKVESGELDAGLVYRTDVRGADVDEVPLAKEIGRTTTYPIAALTDDGRGFVDLVLSAEGRAILADHGFGVP